MVNIDVMVGFMTGALGGGPFIVVHLCGHRLCALLSLYIADCMIHDIMLDKFSCAAKPSGYFFAGTSYLSQPYVRKLEYRNRNLLTSSP